MTCVNGTAILNVNSFLVILQNSHTKLKNTLHGVIIEINRPCMKHEFSGSTESSDRLTRTLDVFPTTRETHGPLASKKGKKSAVICYGVENKVEISSKYGAMLLMRIKKDIF